MANYKIDIKHFNQIRFLWKKFWICFEMPLNIPVTGTELNKNKEHILHIPTSI
jgi:hypothetical protein